jgi:2-polyprenyl-3-methyl-5-hydroxy-6-metoxy-1,4-benzoquinol methylase
MVLDVDGHVMAADELVNRVEQLIRTIDEANPRTRDGAAKGDDSDDETHLGAPILPMSALHRDLYPKDLGEPAGAKGRASKSAKRVVRKLTSWYVEPRWITQQDYDGHNIHFAMGVVDELQRIDRELEELRRQNVQLKLQMVTATERFNRYRRQIDAVVESLPTHDELREVRRELERLGASGSSGAQIDYAAFEDRCRGSSEELREAQARYLTLFPKPDGSGKVVDIGCGRGEMLEVLIEAGYDVEGVDLNPEMVEVCLAKGLPVTKDDGIHFLEQQAEGSLRGIFCAQVVEHLLTSELEELMQLAYRKLLPGGVLVVETINPRSLYALGNHYFADTTHVKPVHPETLRFICEQVGFSQIELLERSAHPMMAITDALPANDVGTTVGELIKSVFGYQDYAIVATR